MHSRLALRKPSFFVRASLTAIAVFALLAIFSVLAPRPAFAQNKAVEAQARALQKKAMEDDYLATDFTKAQEKLNQAIAKCGSDKCSPQLRATLKRDLGVVQVGGQIDKDKGIQNFAEAQALDPALQLDPDLKNKDIEAAWEAAKKPAGGPAATPSTGGTPSGDFTHTPVPEQLVRTPVPVFAEYGGSEAIAKVVVRYKGFGMTEWKSTDAKKMPKGFGALIPCMDVQQGDMLYYIQGFNEEKDVVATGGDRNRPYKVLIKRDKIDGEPPHLPGEAAPTQCADTGDCPPDFPGCKGGGKSTGEPKGKPEGDDCEDDAECSSNSCKNHVCAAGEEKSGDGKLRRVWIGVSAAVDFSLLSSANDVCQLSNTDKSPINSAGYYCTNPDGTDYPDRNDKNGTQNKAIVPGKSDKVSGGSALGNVRVQLTFDYALNPNFMLGARIGFNMLTYPGTAAANDGKASSIGFLHLEARATYVIGKDALMKPGMAPYLFLGAGYSEFTGKVGVTVVEQGQNTNKSVNAWLIGGPAFATIGGGIRYAISPRAALLGGPRISFAFGNAFVPAAGIEMGVQFGF